MDQLDDGIECSNCHKLNEEPDDICIWCGDKLEFKESDNEPSKPEISLISCVECEQKVSGRALTCPKCNAMLRKPCSVCNNDISVVSESCPECGDPKPFSGNNKSKKNVLICTECGTENNPNLATCVHCNELISPHNAIYEQKVPLNECPDCSNLISERASTCPKCKTPTNQPCEICKEVISTWCETCPECGDPNPFNDERGSVTNPVTQSKVDSPADKEQIVNTAFEALAQTSSQVDTNCQQNHSDFTFSNLGIWRKLYLICNWVVLAITIYYLAVSNLINEEPFVVLLLLSAYCVGVIWLHMAVVGRKVTQLRWIAGLNLIPCLNPVSALVVWFIGSTSKQEVETLH